MRRVGIQAQIGRHAFVDAREAALHGRGSGRSDQHARRGRGSTGTDHERRHRQSHGATAVTRAFATARLGEVPRRRRARARPRPRRRSSSRARRFRTARSSRSLQDDCQCSHAARHALPHGRLRASLSGRDLVVRELVDHAQPHRLASAGRQLFERGMEALADCEIDVRPFLGRLRCERDGDAEPVPRPASTF